MPLPIDLLSAATIVTLIWFIAELLFGNPKSKKGSGFMLASCIAFLISIVALGLTVIITTLFKV